MRGADDDARAQPGPGEVGGRLVRDQTAVLDGDHPVAEPGGRPCVAGGEQYGTALCRIALQQAVQPRRLARGHAPGGLVEEEGVRVAEESGGQAEPAVHAPRESAEFFVGQATEADDVQDVVGPGCRNPRGGAEHPQVPPRRTAGMTGHVPEDHADLAGRVRHPVQGTAAEERDTAAALQLEHEPQRGGLAGPLVAEQDGDPAGRGLEAEVVDSGAPPLAGAAGQPDGLDHRALHGARDRTEAVGRRRWGLTRPR